MMPNSAPPPSPSVVSQQGSPLTSATAQFASQMGAQGAPATQGDGSMEFVVGKLKEIEMALTEVAQVLSVKMPQAMPFLQVMAQAGSQLSNTVVSQGSPGQDASGGDPTSGAAAMTAT